jgi:hypothetical protein
MVFSLSGLLFTATAVPAIAKTAAMMSNREWTEIWTSVLNKHVNDLGRIDFNGLRSNRTDLDRVVAFIAAADPASTPDRFPTRNDRLAYYINAYNALAMYGILEDGLPQNLGGLKKIAFFYLRTFTIGGRSISLYNFENDVIRPLGEERIHFALNCMVVSCPQLPRQAFVAETLERQLDAAARTFMGEHRNVQIDAAKREVRLSAIFDFYTKDFLARAPDLISYVNRYSTNPIPPRYRVRFLDYDWTVNDRSRTQ